jgi:hypothetical protein
MLYSSEMIAEKYLFCGGDDLKLDLDRTNFGRKEFFLKIVRF